MIEDYFPCEKIIIVVSEMAGKSTFLDYIIAASGIDVIKVLDEAEQGINVSLLSPLEALFRK